jgi:hypothetical protein
VSDSFAPKRNDKGKAVFAIIIALTLTATILFWAAIMAFQLQGLPLYFSQLGLYLIFFWLALWGMKQEQFSLPVTKQHIVEALAWSVAGWVVFVLVIQLTGLASTFFSLWHLPVRIVEVMSGQSDWGTLLVSLLALFLLGLGFTCLFIRSDNIILTGLVHGLVDYPLVGKNSQVSLIILLTAIGCVEIFHLAARMNSRPMTGYPDQGAR